jgi:hypothetical protein
MKLHWLALWMAFVSLGMLGCGGDNGAATSSDGSGSGEEQLDDAGGDSNIKRREIDRLPAVGAYLPPQDQGRVHLAPPEGWRPVSRDKFLARFVKGNPAELPRITISAADSPSPEVTTLTKDNLSELVPILTEQSQAGKKKPIEPVRPIILGDHVFARHVRIARLNDEPCAIVSLQTVQDGRMYTVELFVKAGSDGSEYAKYLKQSQDAVYAVAANLKFGDEPASAPMSPPADEPPAEEKPVEETATE